jgi:DNA-binding transcriptional ArsR family regulator
MKPVHHPSADEITLPGLMAALSDPVRVQIVRSLAEQGECSCGSFELGIAKATRSHHLRVLREAGLTSTRAQGTHRIVSLRREELDARFPRLLDAVLAAAERDASTGAAPAIVA